MLVFSTLNHLESYYVCTKEPLTTSLTIWMLLLLFCMGYQILWSGLGKTDKFPNRGVHSLSSVILFPFSSVEFQNKTVFFVDLNVSVWTELYVPCDSNVHHRKGRDVVTRECFKFCPSSIKAYVCSHLSAVMINVICYEIYWFQERDVEDCLSRSVVCRLNPFHFCACLLACFLCVCTH